MALMTDGYQTLIGFAADATVLFEDIEVTPPGIEGGGAIDVTTMQNSVYETAVPNALIKLTDGATTVAYDPATVVAEVIGNLVNVNNLITLTFPDGATLAFYGWLDSFKPSSNKKGERPTAEITIIASNLNASNVETAPVFTAAS